MCCQNSCLRVGCYNEFSYLGLLINNTDVFLTTLEAGGSHCVSRVGSDEGPCPGRPHMVSLMARTLTTFMVSLFLI